VWRGIYFPGFAGGPEMLYNGGTGSVAAASAPGHKWGRVGQGRAKSTKGANYTPAWDLGALGPVNGLIAEGVDRGLRRPQARLMAKLREMRRGENDPQGS